MKLIELTRNQYALVDDEDFDRINRYKWRALKTYNIWYAIRSDPLSIGYKKNIYMHREILEVKDKRLIDHINNNGLDNRKENLRFSTNKENNTNSKLKENNTSGYKGVNVIYVSKKKGQRYSASCCGTYIGTFGSAIEAAKAYDNFAEKLFGEFSKTNKKLGLLN